MCCGCCLKSRVCQRRGLHDAWHQLAVYVEMSARLQAGSSPAGSCCGCQALPFVLQNNTAAQQCNTTCCKRAVQEFKQCLGCCFWVLLACPFGEQACLPCQLWRRCAASCLLHGDCTKFVSRDGHSGWVGCLSQSPTPKGTLWSGVY
jgi:hypothetical protein